MYLLWSYEWLSQKRFIKFVLLLILQWSSAWFVDRVIIIYEFSTRIVTEIKIHPQLWLNFSWMLKDTISVAICQVSCSVIMLTNKQGLWWIFLLCWQRKDNIFLNIKAVDKILVHKENLCKLNEMSFS